MSDSVSKFKENVIETITDHSKAYFGNGVCVNDAMVMLLDEINNIPVNNCLNCDWYNGIDDSSCKDCEDYSNHKEIKQLPTVDDKPSDYNKLVMKANEKIAELELKEVQIIGDLNELHTIAHEQNNSGAKYEIKRCMKIIQDIYSKQDTQMKTLYIEITTDEAKKRNIDLEDIFYFCNGKYLLLEGIVFGCRQYYKPLEVSDEFIKWNGGECPVKSNDNNLQVICKDGHGYIIGNPTEQKGWIWRDNEYDIIAYRVKKEKASEGKNCDNCDRMPMNKKCFMDCSRQIDSDSDIDLFETKEPTQTDLISRVIEEIYGTNFIIKDDKHYISVAEIVKKIKQIQSEGNNENSNI
jgi:hypothetical protein